MRALGIGAQSSATLTDLGNALAGLKDALAGHGNAPAGLGDVGAHLGGDLRIDTLATLDRLGPVVAPFADRGAWPLLLFTAAELAAMPTPHTVRRTGAPSVAEAAALRAAGPAAVLLIPKTTFTRVTLALAITPPAPPGAAPPRLDPPG
ncbi:cobalamin biosynthesis protein [Actinoplanes sp. N902-109]|uniref:cobalamin biosynthesis protein n=1 Tax=Actinoplanes sp. (strain N902-109) TaxID=649831 RepID=UPI000329611A|nr:cobalamin biosynthesis protein [Actinoplanes sp. N902-109]AGL18688.1 hypothetical protein L083_5178 [Actinoplanes sp. N902-109]